MDEREQSVPMIRVKGLHKVYRVGDEQVHALRGIDLDIMRGEICCIFGTSGSGKSTLLNQLAGMEKPSKGDVFIGKAPISRMDENLLAAFRQRHLGFIFQSYNLLPFLTAVENVALPLSFHGVDKKTRTEAAAAMLKRVGLEHRLNHYPGQMSGGQQQRVGIARAFVGKPAVIFADEPTGNLDSHTTVQVMNAILSLIRKHKITFVMVTHERELAACADRIITLRDGKVLRNETIEHPQAQYIMPDGKNEDDLNDSSFDEDFGEDVPAQQQSAPQNGSPQEAAQQQAEQQVNVQQIGEEICRMKEETQNTNETTKENSTNE